MYIYNVYVFIIYTIYIINNINTHTRTHTHTQGNICIIYIIYIYTVKRIIFKLIYSTVYSRYVHAYYLIQT